MLIRTASPETHTPSPVTVRVRNVEHGTGSFTRWRGDEVGAAQPRGAEAPAATRPRVRAAHHGDDVTVNVLSRKGNIGVTLQK